MGRSPPQPVIQPVVFTERPLRTTQARAPVDRNSCVRASIFDLFHELGGLENDSTLADWIFNDPSQVVDSDSLKSGVRFREDTGSRFREAGLDNEGDENPYRRNTRTTTPGESRASRFFAKVRSRSRSKSRTRGNVASEKTLNDMSSPTSSTGKKKPWFKSRSSFDDSRAAAPPLPADSLEKIESTRLSRPSSHSSQSTVKLAASLPTSPATMSVKEYGFPSSSSDTATINDDDWERVSLAPSQLLMPTQSNIFLHGPHDGSKLKKPVAHDAGRRFSLLPSRTARLSLFTIRRTSSKPESPTIPVRTRAFSFSAVSPSPNPLTTTLTHQ